MNNIKKLLSVFLVAAMVISMAACHKNPADNPGSDPSDNAGTGEKGSYTVTVQSAGKMALNGIDVYVYNNESMDEMVALGKTDEEGKVSFDIPKSDKYVIVLPNVPKGYAKEESYSFSGNAALITLTSSPIEGEDMAGATFQLGDVMYDFEITTTDGTAVKLSDVLAEKKVVLLNFWFSTCGPCISEVPYMEEAYQMYKDKAEILAVNSYAPDDDDSVAAFKEQHKLSFPMAKVPDSWASLTNGNYPTTYVIDRYGVVCLVEVGALPSLRPFVAIMDYFTADDYQQKLCDKGVASVISNVKPNVEMPSTEEISNTINSGDINITYRPETGKDAEYSWPFIIAEKNGIPCIKPSNSGYDASYAMLHADVELKKGQAIAFEYLSSTEAIDDMMVVLVDGEPIYQISGNSEKEEWKAAYPWVAQKDGTYTLSLIYTKDDDGNEGDDTVYIKNMHIVDSSKIDVETYLPSYAATTEDGKIYDYVDIFYNEADGYYHVGSKTGPLLLANLMGTSDFNSETSIWDMAGQGMLKDGDRDLEKELLPYASYASRSKKSGYCTVTEELMQILKDIDRLIGFDDKDDNEWLKLCMYYNAYGTEGKQLGDPIKGLAPFCAYEAKLGDNVISYDGRPLMPKGLLSEFIPAKSGVYRIITSAKSSNGLEGWIVNEKGDVLVRDDVGIRNFNDPDNICMYLAMNAGTSYYINLMFWDLYEAGDIAYKIEYVAPQYDLFCQASPSYFTFETDENGDVIGEGTTVAGGIDVVLGSDGYYRHDLGKDANGKQIYGSKIYADFIGVGIFNLPIASVPAYNADGTPALDSNGKPVMIKGLLDIGAFDFTMTEEDLFIVQVLRNSGNDVEAADAALRKMWGAEYAKKAEQYQIEDVFDGIYHGTGKDETEVVRSYLNKMVKDPNSQHNGCVLVDEELARVLWLLMDKFTFKSVENSWLKICYYYDHLAPQA